MAGPPRPNQLSSSYSARSSSVTLIVEFSLLWAPFGWLVLMIMGYGLLAFLVSVGFQYPNLEWDDPRRMSNRKAGLPMLIGSFLYSLVGIVVAVATYALANGQPSFAIPIVIMGLAILAGGTWFFVHTRVNTVEAVWPQIGA